MALLLALAVAAVALEAHARGRAPGAAARRAAIGLLLAGAAIQTAMLRLFHAAPDGEAPGHRVALALVAGLAAWAGLARLLAVGARKRDLVTRAILAAVALAVAPFSIQVSAVTAALALFSFRWTGALSTRARLGLALAFALLFALGLGARSPEEGLQRGAGAAALGASRWLVMVTRFYLFLGTFALFRAFIRDPSLGVRTVGRRLALSHVLVVAVPLLLLGGLWTFTTVLGVNADRAMVASRALEVEGRLLRSALGEVLAAGPAAEGAARSRLSSRGRDWSDARVWLRERGEWRRLLGDSLPGERRYAAWLDSLGRLPESGIVGADGRARFGAARLDPADSTRGAVALVDAESLLLGGPSAVSGTRVVVALRDLVVRGERLVSVTGAGSPAEPGAPAPAMTPRDSADLERARRVLRRLGLPDSAVRADAAARPRGVSVAGQPVGGPGENFLVDGHALVPGLSWTGTKWRSTRALISARVDPAAALMGLYRNFRDNPFTVLPIMLILGLTALVLMVAIFDFVMVAGLARSITAAIRALQGGAARLEAGDLSHRIEVRGEDDLWSVAGAFNQAIAGFERSRELEIERGRLENELALARQIQSRLLPAGPPSVEGLEVAGHYDPARQVGGDYYDHLDLGGGRVLLVIADVSGKGVPAALLMSGFRASLMSQDLAGRDPVALAGHLNDFLLRSVEMGKFVTAFLAFADVRAGTLDYVNAGHNPPLLLSADGSSATLEAGGLMFGVMPGAPYEAGRAAFRTGDLLALYTDGVTEGAGPGQELWGEERLLAALRRGAGRSCGDLVRSVAGEVRAFEGEHGPADDVTLLLARRV